MDAEAWPSESVRGHWMSVLCGWRRRGHGRTEGIPLRDSETENKREGSPRPPRSPGQDLTSFLAGWDYDGEEKIRRVKASDGREVIQVRLPLGVEQYELEGRPDGKRPMGHESWFHHYVRELRAHARESKEFRLTSEDFSRLHEEGLLYYHRYLLFFQIQEYRLCARDTRRNLRLVAFVSRFASPEQATELAQYKPYIIRMHVMARALRRIQARNDLRGALHILRRGLKLIEAFRPLRDTQVFQWEKTRSKKMLADLISQLEAHVPLSRRAMLKRQMNWAVREEDYEKAAEIRDQIASLRKRTKGP